MADFTDVIVSDYLGYILALIIFISDVVHLILDYKMSADEEIEKKELKNEYEINKLVEEL